jgi:hypothetical protein
MQFGAYSFVETRCDSRTGEPVDVDKTFANVLAQIELADRVGLDVFWLGEHHRPDYAVSAPAVALAGALSRHCAGIEFADRSWARATSKRDSCLSTAMTRRSQLNDRDAPF